MILFRSSLFALAAAVPLAAQPGSPSPAPVSRPSTAAAPEFTEEQLLETFGWFLGRRAGLPELEFTDQDITSIIRGLQQAARGEDAPYDLETIGPSMEVFMNEKQDKFMGKLREAGIAESEAFLAQIREKDGVVSTASGLAYEILESGEGRKPKPTDVLRVHYTGTLVNGTVFDSSLQRGEPEEIQLNSVIPGWIEGLQQIGAGGKIRLYVPADLAYGDEGAPGVPPASALVFEVELLEVKDAPANPLAK